VRLGPRLTARKPGGQSSRSDNGHQGSDTAQQGTGTAEPGEDAAGSANAGSQPGTGNVHVHGEGSGTDSGDAQPLDDTVQLGNGTAEPGSDTAQLDPGVDQHALATTPLQKVTSPPGAAAPLRKIGSLARRGAAVTRVGRIWQPGPGVREAADPGGRAFALITVMPVVLLIAWLVPGLALLLAGRFLPAAMVLISVAAAVALAMLVAREIPGRWRVLDTKEQKSKSRSWAAWWGLGGTVAIAVAFAVWQIAVNSPQFIVSRDPGAYLQFAYWIANHGSLPIPASHAAFGGSHPGLTFASFGFAAHGGALVPGLPAGLPVTLAAGMWITGVTGAAVISPLLGALAVLTVGGLTGRLAGPQWAPLGALLLALTVPEIYTSRSAFSEPLAQALLFGGLCLIVDSFSSRRQITLSALGGLALGFTVLAGTGFLVILLPAIPVAGALLAARKPQGIPLAAGLLAGVICAVIAGVGLGIPAAGTTTFSFGMIGALAGGFTVLTAAGVSIGLIGPLRRRARKLFGANPLRWLPEAAAVVVALAAIDLAIRPYVQTVRGPASPYVAALQRLEGLPVDPGRLYAENSLYWVIWYLGVPALLLGLIGLVMVTRQCVRALITWRDPTRAARAWALPAGIIGWGLFTVLWKPGTVPDQPWASRVLVPVVLPGLVVLAVWVAAWIIDRAHARAAGVAAVSVATACFVVALGVAPAAITFGIEVSHPSNPATRTALSGLAFRRTGAGQIPAVGALCGAIPPHSTVILLDKVAARAFTQVIRGTCGVPAGVMTSSAPGQVDAVIGGIERAGRHPALLATRATELAPYGASPRQVVNLATQQDAHLLTRPPTTTWPVHYVLWMSAPSGAAFGS
jgi:hypothetical protein